MCLLCRALWVSSFRCGTSSGLIRTAASLKFVWNPAESSDIATPTLEQHDGSCFHHLHSFSWTSSVCRHVLHDWPSSQVVKKEEWNMGVLLWLTNVWHLHTRMLWRWWRRSDDWQAPRGTSMMFCINKTEQSAEQRDSYDPTISDLFMWWDLWRVKHETFREKSWWEMSFSRGNLYLSLCLYLFLYLCLYFIFIFILTHLYCEALITWVGGCFYDSYQSYWSINRKWCIIKKERTRKYRSNEGLCVY